MFRLIPYWKRLSVAYPPLTQYDANEAAEPFDRYAEGKGRRKTFRHVSAITHDHWLSSETYDPRE